MNNNYSGIAGFAMNMINSNPEIRNNPNFAEMIAAIEQGNAQKGQEIANRILKNNGYTIGQGVQRAAQFFNLPGQF